MSRSKALYPTKSYPSLVALHSSDSKVVDTAARLLRAYATGQRVYNGSSDGYALFVSYLCDHIVKKLGSVAGKKRRCRVRPV